MRCALLFCLAVSTIGVPTSHAQWNPANGEWRKTEATDIRVMTLNVNRRLDTDATKQDTLSAWSAAARLIAGLRPDVLLLQEPANGDPTVFIETNMQLLIEGGTDIFGGTGEVTAYAKKYAPDFEMPYIFVSTAGDGFITNVIMSRYPFVDLNGDGVSQMSDIPWITSHLYAPGGDGGIRGFQMAEIDLPDDIYRGDLVIGNAHLKAFSGQSEHNQRVTAARNVAYYIDHVLNGAGLGVVDPFNKVNFGVRPTTVLDEFTPVIIGGDWNEDESLSPFQYGDRGPAGYFTQAGMTGGTDGTDRDRTDMMFDSAFEPNHFSAISYPQSPFFDDIDYIAWQDSIATSRREFIFDTQPPFNPQYYEGQEHLLPEEVRGFSDIPFLSSGIISGTLSDHRPVIADFILPLVPPTLCGDANCDGAANTSDIDAFVTAVIDGEAAWTTLTGGACDFILAVDTNGDGNVNSSDIDGFVFAVLNGGCE